MMPEKETPFLHLPSPDEKSHPICNRRLINLFQALFGLMAVAFRDKDEQSSSMFRDSEMHAERMAKRGKWPRRTVFLLTQLTLSSA